MLTHTHSFPTTWERSRECLTSRSSPPQSTLPKSSASPSSAAWLLPIWFYSDPTRKPSRDTTTWLNYCTTPMPESHQARKPNRYSATCKQKPNQLMSRRSMLRISLSTWSHCNNYSRHMLHSNCHHHHSKCRSKPPLLPTCPLQWRINPTLTIPSASQSTTSKTPWDQLQPQATSSTPWSKCRPCLSSRRKNSWPRCSNSRSCPSWRNRGTGQVWSATQQASSPHHHPLQSL